MLTNTKITLSVALVLATVSTAFAAPKHKQATVRHQPTIERKVPASAYRSFGAVRSTGSVTTPSNSKCWGGSCSPDWQINNE